MTLENNYFFKKKIRSFIKKHSMTCSGDTVLVACSGGADSTSLLYVLHLLKEDLKINLICAHLNHNLRGMESEKDEIFLKDYAKSLNIDFKVKSVDTLKFLKESKLSLHEGARRLRYDFFYEILKETKQGKIAFAHTFSDQAETVLMRIIRGSGLKGVSGIPLKRDNIIRPFMETKRAEIEAFLIKNKIKWREDSSNKKTKYLRNKIRLKLLPKIKKDYNPNINSTLYTLSNIVKEDDSFLDDYSNLIFKKIAICKDDNLVTFSVTDFKKLHNAIKRRIVLKSIEYLKNDTKNVSYIHIDDIINLFNKGTLNKSIDISCGICVSYEGSFLNFSRGIKDLDKVDFNVCLNLSGETEILNADMAFYAKVYKKENVIFNFKDKNTAYIDLKKVQGALFLRNRKPGDRFVPFGKKSEKKLKTFFIDEKVPLKDRDSIPVLLTQNGVIVWVCGIRTSNLFKVDESTKNVLVICYERQLRMD